MLITKFSETKDTNVDQRARYALLASIAFIGIFGTGAIVALILARTTGIGQFYILFALSTISTIFNGYSIYLARQKNVSRAVTFAIAGIILLLPFTTVLITGVGLFLGVVGFIIIFMISVLTLVQPQLTWGVGAGILLGVATILLEIFYPGQRLEVPLVRVLIPVISSFSLIFFGYYIYQNFSDYPFQIKLILLFTIISGFSVGSVAFIINNQVRNEIARQVGEGQQILAERLARETGNELDAQIEKLIATNTQFEEIAKQKSESYSGSEDVIVNRILELDRQWLTASDNNNLILNVIQNDTANELREFRDEFPNHVELFITDKYGANIAATNRTSDYYQADEDWWQITYSLGRGRVYIGQPEFDESSQTYSIDMAIPIYSDDEVVGVLRSTYSVNAIIESLNQITTEFTNKSVDLRIFDNNLISGELIAGNELQDLSTVMSGYGEISYRGKPYFVSQERVFSGVTSRSGDAISQLGWSIIIYEDPTTALSAVQTQTRIITIFALLITAAVAVFGFYASQRLSAPILTLTEATRRFALGHLAVQAKIPTQDEFGDLASSFNEMTQQLRNILNELENRVTERTVDLDMARLISERRAQDLQSISEISRAISTEQKLEILLPLITRLVSERFDFYHTGIFFVDESKRFAHLQAANSEGGQTMLNRGHRLEIGKGLVGTVIKTGDPRIALDVGSDAVFFDNPDLPNTRSEMALPLSIRGNIIGVLDVQSTNPGAFTDENIQTLSILADQVAIAIENARLFTQTQQARLEAESLYAQVIRKEWSAFAKREDEIGYHKTSYGGGALSKPVQSNEISRALENGQIIVHENSDNSGQPSFVTVPIKLRGNVIGVINIKASNQTQKWNNEEIALVQTISDSLALSLDNARLIYESQLRAAREAKIGEVSSKIGSSIDLSNMLQTAVEELGRAIPGTEVIIQFDTINENKNGSNGASEGSIHE